MECRDKGSKKHHMFVSKREQEQGMARATESNNATNCRCDNGEDMMAASSLGDDGKLQVWRSSTARNGRHHTILDLWSQRREDGRSDKALL